MSRYRINLPQLGNKRFLADGGLETTLIFHTGIDLPLFAAYPLATTEDGREVLRQYYRPYVTFARAHGFGFILDSATWRASHDWGAKLGHTDRDLEAINSMSIRMLEDLRAENETASTPIVVSGAVGPRGDGYIADESMTAREAAEYHEAQIATFANTSADMVTAFTMANSAEAAGIALAAGKHDMPSAISFTLETDGRLPSGETLREAIGVVESAAALRPVYYMINCAHPTHFAHIFADGGSWIERVKGIRANASCRSHAELNEASDLDAGDPVELGAQYADLLRRLPHLTVFGGCCGTDHRHVQCIGESCKAAA